MTQYYTPTPAPAAAEPKDEMQQVLDEHRAPVIERDNRLRAINERQLRATMGDVEYERRYGDR